MHPPSVYGRAISARKEIHPFSPVAKRRRTSIIILLYMGFDFLRSVENCSFLGRKRGGVEIALHGKSKFMCNSTIIEAVYSQQSGGVEEWSESSFPGENFSQNFSYNFSECLYNFITFSHFLYELKHFSENLHLFSENQHPVSKFSVYFNYEL